METISYTYARNNLAEVTERVCRNHDAVIITRQGADAVVLLSLEDYEALEETAFLLRSPRNAQRLAEAIAEVESGQAQPHELIETE